MPKILFRADAEESIGTGDLMSLIYLSREFQKNFWHCFFMVKDYAPASRIIEKYKLNNVFLIPNKILIKDEVRYMKNFCKENSIDCLLMEITKSSLAEYVDLGNLAPLKVCINFDGVIISDFDIVVNWNINSSDPLYDSYKGGDKQFILGFENTILPDYFNWDRIKERKYTDGVKRILVTMGGIDEFDLTRKVVEALVYQADKFELLIITGAGYKYQEDLSRFIKSNFKKYVIKNNVDNLFEAYLWADLAFSAGGLTSSELVATKTPAMLIAAYEHQIGRCEFFAEKQWSSYIGYRTKIDRHLIIRALEDAIKNIHIYRDNFNRLNFKGGNEKIFKDIDSRRKSKQLV